MKNIINGIILILYTCGFFFIVFASLDYILLKNVNRLIHDDAILLLSALSLTGIFTMIIYVVRKIISKSEIIINFWTFVPIIIYGTIIAFMHN